MGKVTVILDDGVEAALWEAIRTAGVSPNKWLSDMICRHFERSDGGAEMAPILIADDDPVWRELLQSLVEHLGWRADLAEDGASALARLAERPYRLLLTDWRMPIMDGLQLTRAIRHIERHRRRGRLPIVAVTSESLGGEEVCLRKLDLDGYLCKPVDFDALARTLSVWLGAPCAFAHVGTQASAPVHGTVVPDPR